MKFPVKSTAIVIGGAAAIMVVISGLGEYTVKRLLVRDAIISTELWERSAIANGAADPADIVRRLTSDKGRSALQVVHIDGVALTASATVSEAVGAVPAEAGADLDRVIAATVAPDDSATLPEVRTTDRVGLLGTERYRSWVILPARQPGGPRLAARVEQSATATELMEAFRREILFSSGVAIITFGAFMAGFRYRARQLSAENAAIRYLAMHDELTGLPNRTQFEHFMATALAAVGSGRHKVALFILDLDGFKTVNDTFGHPVGDELLKAAANRLKASLRGGDLLARLAGDEFVIAVPHLPDPAMLAPMAERIMTMLSAPFRIENQEIQIGCSIGLAVAPDNGADTDRLMRNADFALYRAKSEGRRTWRFFDPTMAAEQASRRSIEDGLRHALENDLFGVFYQPQVSLSSGRVTGYEAVLRWRLPGKGIVPAAVFVPIAEETGLVVPIGEWVVRQVARDCARIPADRRVAVNLSAAHLRRDGVDDFILSTLRAHAVEPSRLEIEVNESILGRNSEAAFERLRKLREGGLAIIMDSFGVGSLNLGVLSRYSFDKVKIDRKVMLEDEQKGLAVLAAICSLGRSLGFRVAGQGVETAEHAHLLRMAGCAEGQGYYFAEPMPLEEVLRREQQDRGAEMPAEARLATA